MKNNNLIEERDERTRRRKKAKRKMDSIIGLGYHDEDKHVMSLSVNLSKLSDKRIRLLDEGYIDNGFVIKKGTMEKFLNGQNQYVRGVEMDEDGNWTYTDVLNITDDFVGTVNLGHMDFATFPFIIGEWRKSDLTLVDVENDRKALDVDLHLDEDSVFVSELKRQPYDIGVSAEFYYHVNEEDTNNLTEMLGYWMPVLDEVYIFAYGLVGECGNVNSSGLELTKEMEMPNKKKDLAEIIEIEELDAEAQVDEEALELSEAEEIEIEPTVDEEEPTEEANDVQESETEEEEAVEEESEAELSSEEVVVEEAMEESFGSDEDEDEEADDAFAEVLANVTALTEQIAELNNTIAEQTQTIVSLKQSNRKLQKKLASERDKKEKFFESAKDISVELLPNENKKKEEEKELAADRNYLYGDGIGE